MKLIIGFSVVVDYLLCSSLLSVELLTVTFLTATVTDKRRLHFLAFYVCQVIFTVNHLGEIFAAFHGIFQFIKTLQTWCWLKKIWLRVARCFYMLTIMGLIGFILEFLSKACSFLTWEQPKFLDAIHHWFPHEKRLRKAERFRHTNDVSLRRSGSCFWLVARASREICFYQSEAATQICIVIFYQYGIEVIRKGSSDYVAKYRLF